MAKLSLIVPVFNEQDTVNLFYDAIEEEHKNFADYELEVSWF